MRILHFIPDIGISNGVMSVILNYAKAMPADIKFDVVYFHEKEQTRKADIEALGGRVYKIDRPAPKDIFSKKSDDFFKAHPSEWQALHIHAPHFAVFIAPAAKRAGIRKICVHCHTTEYSLKGNAARNRLLSLYAKYGIEDKFACSENAGKLWYGNQPFTVLNNAIDCARYTYSAELRNEMRRALELGDAFAVCHIGRTDIPQKNHPFIFEVFASLARIKPNAKLLLIGAEPTAELEKIAKANGITDRIIYLGFRSDIPQLLQAMDAFLFPSTGEGLPVSVIEAQASGLPVLMSDVITSEVAVTDLVKSLPLTTSYETWANTLLAIQTAERVSPAIPEWDIYKCAKQLIDYYSL